MIIIDYTEYVEKQNIDDNLPPCSMCQLPLNKCTQQCKNYGDNFFFIKNTPMDDQLKLPNNFSGCLKPIFYGCAIIAGILLAILVLS